MTSFLTNLSPRRAALIAGLAFIVSVVFAVAVDDFLLANLVPPGDAAALDIDIRNDPDRLGVAALGYLLVLLLDVLIALCLFVVIRPASARLARAVSFLRVFYAGIVGAGVIALSFQVVDAYAYSAIKTVAYVFFVLHLLTLGLSVFRADYLPNVFSVGLLIGAAAYSVFFIDLQLPETANFAAMLIMAFAELSLFVWLIAGRNHLPS